MKVQAYLPVIMAAALGLTSLNACNSNTKQGTAGADSTDSSHIRIEPLQSSKDFPDAKLDLQNVKAEMAGTDSAKLTFNFGVQNYELTQQTMDMNSGECANSGQGQHIHFIMDNQPYQALYKPENTVTLPVNSEHYLLCFLSRSYHLSVKSPGASVLVHFKIDDKGKYVKMDDPTAPMLFYSRPKGEYKGDDTKNLLLDFYVANATLGADSYKVKVDLPDTSFTVDQWQPYFIKNAPMGKMKVGISLLDKDGKQVSGDNTQVEREITLSE